MKSNRVVVTGYGAITSMGNNVDEIWNNIMDYQIGYKQYDLNDDSINAKYFGFIDFERKLIRSFPKKISKMLPMFAKYSLIASQEALKMSFGDTDIHSLVSPFDCGVIIGTGWGGLDNANINNNDYQDSGIATSFSTVMSMCNIATAATSMNWGFRGYQNTPVAACATGTIAIGDAYEAIKNGKAKVMLAGGSESLKDTFNVWSIDVMQALTKEQDNERLACCPFSKNRSGFVLSEGASILCLEDYEFAKARGANIIAEIKSYTNYSDAYDMTAPAEDMLARVKVIKELFENCDIAPNDIDYVNLHGTSTPLNDINETNSIKESLGNVAYQIPMSSTKSYTGHLIGAAGALESIFCIKAIETGTIPATIHLDEPDQACDLNYVPNKHLHGQKVTSTMNVSFGFGGANAGIIISKFKD